MSRIGKKPIIKPKNVAIKVENGILTVEGPKGKLTREVNPGFKIEIDQDTINVSRPSELKKDKEYHGLIRVLLQNMITGVEKGIEKKLEIVGVGYKVLAEGNGVKFQLGYSHPVVVQPPDGIKYTIEGTNFVVVSGIDKEKVGQAAANLRKLRLPEPYKGKGVRYAAEKIKIKPGKTGKTA